MFNLLSISAEPRETPGKGHGSFAIRTIPRGEFVVCFGGTPLDLATFAKYTLERRSRSIQIDHDLIILGPPEREPGDSINHSCDPNLGLVAANRLVARRDIAIGEELTYDYATSDSAPYDEFDCACSSPSCRTTVRGSDWKRATIQELNAGWFSPYLARRIDGLTRARPLTKRDVEALMAGVDHDPGDAVLRAVRTATGLTNASWATARALLATVGIAMPSENDIEQPASLDDAVRWLNETRGRELSSAE